MPLCAADCACGPEYVEPIPIDLVSDCSSLGAEISVSFYVSGLHVQSIPVELSGFDCTRIGQLYRPGFLLVPRPNVVEGRFVVECERDGQTCCNFTQVGP